MLAIAVGPSFGDGDPGTFDPTVTFETSTTRATAHPDARITIDNTGNTANIGSVTLSLPDGFWGSLAAVSAKCATFDPIAGGGTAQCAAANQIGTVTATAKIDNSDAKLTGQVYLVDSATNAADIGIQFHAKVGGVDLGYVRVRGYANIRGNAVGLDTVVESIPGTITDEDNREVSFHLNKMVLDLKSDLDGPYKPLLTNPSKCGATALTGTIGSGPTLGNIDDVPVNIPYTVDGCDTANFDPSAFSFTNSSQAAGSTTALSTQVDFPANSATAKSLKVVLPSTFGANMPSFGTSADQCPPESFPPLSATFDASYCPAAARVGYMTITTPLLPDPVVGDVYLIGNNPLPWLGVTVSQGTGFGGNPPGVNINLIGETTLEFRDATCVSSCIQAVTATFNDIPDAPLESALLEIPDTTRRNTDDTLDLSGKILTVAGPGSNQCQAADDVTAAFTSHSTVTDISATPKRNWLASTVNVTGCTIIKPVTIDSGPMGTRTTDTTPSIGFTAIPPAGPNFFCAANAFSPASPGTACTSPFTPTLQNGVHRIYVGTGTTVSSSNVTRAFAVGPDPVTPGPAPSTSFSTTPPAETGTTPSFSFQSDQSSKFQCSIDNGAFLPCGTTASYETTGSFDVPSADAFLAGSNHTFEVRAQNAAGTIDTSPASATFDVTVAFAPTFNADVSTNVARSHPDLDITITNPSEEDLKDVTIKLPNGFFGGLQGVQSVCPVATADAGNCTSASEVGTVETEAVVDESIIRINGTVYITDPRVSGDAAGLSIKVPAIIQDIDLGDVIVPARLKVRGNGEGLDNFVIDAPRQIVPPTNPYGDTTTDFNLQKMVIKLRTGPGAAQPLLTNPSSCTPSNFAAEFQGYGSTTGSVLQPYGVAGCQALAFTPALSATITRSIDGKAPTAAKYQDVSLTANLFADPGQAGISAASVLMPKPLTINLAKLGPLCEQGQYETDTCPAATVIGTATATTPLLPPGQVLTGPAYLLRGSGTVLPRIFVRLKDPLQNRISISVVGQSSFENTTQIRTIFKDLPDAPLNSFSLTVGGLLSTTKKPCQDAMESGASMTGTLSAHNGKDAPVSSEFNFDCSGTYFSHKYKKGKKPSLKMYMENRGTQPKTKKITLKLGKGLTLNKKALSKKLIVTADGKKLKAKCFKYKKPAVLEIGFCGKQVSKVSLNFKSGALKVYRLRSPRVTVTTVEADNKKTVVPFDLRKPIASPELPFVAD